MMTGLDEHMDEFLAEKAAREAAEKAAAQEQEEFEYMYYSANQDNASWDKARARFPMLAAIANAAAVHPEVVKRGLEVVIDETKTNFTIGGVGTNYILNFEEERTHSSPWRSTKNGKFRVTVGDYGNRTSYPQKKDGTHSYAKIAETLVWFAVREIEKKQKAAVAAGNVGTVAALRKEIGLREYCSIFDVKPVGSVDLPVYVTVAIKGAMTVEQARALAAGIKAAGIKLD